MKIEQAILPPSKWSRPQIPLVLITGIVIHWVANAGATAKQIRDYFATVSRHASAHYIIDVDGSIIQAVPEDEVAYHAGPSDRTREDTLKRLGGLPNWRTVGIELCHPDWTGEFTGRTIESAISLTADIGSRKRVDVLHNVLRHYDCTGKYCPKYYVDHPEAWRDFREDVSIAMAPRNVSRL